MVEGSRTAVGTRGALTDCAPRGSCSGPCAGTESQSRITSPSAHSCCARSRAAGGSLTLAAALYSGKCRGLSERPLRSQVAGGATSGEGAGAAAGRTDALCRAARPGSVPEPARWGARVTGSRGAQAVKEFPEHWKGLGEERGPCKRRKQRDRRKEQGWDESSPSRGAREGAGQARGRLRVPGCVCEFW